VHLAKCKIWELGVYHDCRKMLPVDAISPSRPILTAKHSNNLVCKALVDCHVISGKPNVCVLQGGCSEALVVDSGIVVVG